MGKTRRNRVVAVLGAGAVLAAVLGGAGPAALARPASAPALKVCPAIEALVSDGVSGPGLGGEVLRVTPGGQSTLTTNTSPPGAPRLDTPSDMAFLANGDIVITDEGPGGSAPDVVEVDPATGDRTLLSDNATPSGSPKFDTPSDVAYSACENAFYVLQTGFTPSTPPGKVLKIDATTGATLGTRSLFAKYLGAENYALLIHLAPPQLPGGGSGGGTGGDGGGGD